MEIYRFIAFGCWNKGYCTPVSEINKEIPQNGVTNTMNILHKFIYDTKNIVDLFVLGDNYYPIKIKDKNKENKKTMDEKNLISGIECIKNIPIPNSNKYILLGNHDLDNDKYNSDFNCNILKIQTDLFKNNNMNFFSFGKNFQSKIIGNHTLIILLDTTMYEIMSNAEMINYLECYNIFENNIIDKNKLTNISQLQVKQQQIVNDIITNVLLTNNIKNIITMGHHPILGVKYKEEKDIIKYDHYPNLIDLLYNEIYNKVNNCNFYHICSDIHQYQKSNLKIKHQEFLNNEININQYVVGTGGADKDTIIPENERNGERNINNYIIKYEITDSLSENGFLDCKIVFNTKNNSDDEIEFDFINSGSYTKLTNSTDSKKSIKNNKTVEINNSIEPIKIISNLINERTYTKKKSKKSKKKSKKSKKSKKRPKK